MMYDMMFIYFQSISSGFTGFQSILFISSHTLLGFLECRTCKLCQTCRGLKNLKKQEIQRRLEQIREVTGV